MYIYVISYIYLYKKIYIYIYISMTSKNNKVIRHLYSYFHNLMTTVEVNQRQNTKNRQYVTHISML